MREIVKKCQHSMVYAYILSPLHPHTQTLTHPHTPTHTPTQPYPHPHLHPHTHNDTLSLRFGLFQIISFKDCPRKNFALRVSLSSAGLIPGPVLSLKSALDASRPSLTLNWEKPNNVKTARDVTKYDIRFRPFQTTTHHCDIQSQSRSGPQEDYCTITVDEPTTSAFLARESGLKPLIKYDFEVRARNSSHEGKWSKVSEYIGMCTC